MVRGTLKKISGIIARRKDETGQKNVCQLDNRKGMEAEEKGRMW